MAERITARGHEHVSATHQSTLEFTTDDFLTPAGDCILGIEADRSPADFDPAFVEACQDLSATISATIQVGDREATVTGHGHPDLSFSNERSLVIRTSDYVDDRTVMVGADKAAADIDRTLIANLEAGETVTLELSVEN